MAIAERGIGDIYEMSWKLVSLPIIAAQSKRSERVLLIEPHRDVPLK